MALLPFFGYLFGRFVTHTMEVRYVIAALIRLRRHLRHRPRAQAPQQHLLLRNARHHLHRRHRDQHPLHPPGAPRLRRHPRQLPAHPRSRRRAPSKSARAHLPPEPQRLLPRHLLRSRSHPAPPLLSPLRPAPGDLLAPARHQLRHRREHAHLRTALPHSYADFLKQPHPLLILNHSGWEWIDKQLNADHTPQQALADCLRGQLIRVTNPPLPAK